jgi:hypothetical protein
LCATHCPVLHDSNKTQHNNNEAAVQLLFSDEVDDSIEAQAINGSTATIKVMLIRDEQHELIAMAIRDSGTGMDVTKLKAALIPHLTMRDRVGTSAVTDSASSDDEMFRTNATGKLGHHGIGGNTTGNSLGKTHPMCHSFCRDVLQSCVIHTHYCNARFLPML